MLSIIGKLMHPLFSQRAKAPGRSQMLTPSGMLKLRFRLGTKFLAFESSGHLPQIATVVSICFVPVFIPSGGGSASNSKPWRRGLPGTPGWGTWEMAVAGGF